MSDFIQGLNWGKMNVMMHEEGFDYESARIAVLSAIFTELSGLDSVYQVNVGELRAAIIDAWFSALGDDD